MTEYHKIETIFERDPVTFIVDHTKFKNPAIPTINLWHVDEKIDGMNIRVILSPERELSFRGRTDKADLPQDLLKYLEKTFALDQLKSMFPDGAVLYGEGYGGNIQAIGKQYRSDKSFILFDIKAPKWLERAEVEAVAQAFNIDMVPYLGMMPLDQIINTVKEGFNSSIGTAKAEGIIARPLRTLYDERGNRVIIKLKTKDFIGGKR